MADTTELALQKELGAASKQLLDLKQEASLILFDAQTIAIMGEFEVAEGRKLLGAIGTVSKKLKAMIKPVKDAFNAFLKSLSEDAEKADTLLRGKLNAYAAEEERKRREAEAEIVAKQKAAGIKNPVPVSIPTTVDSGFRTYWRWRVVDEAKIPERYWERVLNTKLIGQEVTAQKGAFKVPGLEAYEDKGVVAG